MGRRQVAVAERAEEPNCPDDVPERERGRVQGWARPCLEAVDAAGGRGRQHAEQRLQGYADLGREGRDVTDAEGPGGDGVEERGVMALVHSGSEG